MTYEQAQYLVKFPDHDACTRAVRWAWFEMPKRYYDEEHGWRRITKIDQSTFQYLKQHRDEYYLFLKNHNLEKTLYDKYIGKHEIEARTVW